MKGKMILICLLFLATSTFSQNTCPDVPSVIYEGKLYHTVQIGTQCWLKENLDVGNMVFGNQNQSNNNIIEKYCYDDNPENCATYGGLYQWNEAMAYEETPETKGICPENWHIPTETEFQALEDFVKNNSTVLKEVGQGIGEGAGTNTSGFSALLGGHRRNYNYFERINTETDFWISFARLASDITRIPHITCILATMK